MVLRVTFFALMALGLLGLGFIGYNSMQPAPGTVVDKTVPTTINLLAVAHDVTAGNLLKPSDLVSRTVAKTAAPADATLDTDDERRALYGAMVRRSLAGGEVIRLGDALRPGDHGFLAAVLRPDMRAVTVGVDAISGTAGLIWPGDRVDLILTQTIGDPALPVGRRIVAETVVANVRVIAIDQRMVEGAANSIPTPEARTVTLEVSKEDAQGVQVAVRLGRLSLSVRPADGPPEIRPKASTTWASDVSPALADDLHPSTIGQSIKVWQSSGEGKDFKF
jgi:pilus assembly protein CpaB